MVNLRFSLYTYIYVCQLQNIYPGFLSGGRGSICPLLDLALPPWKFFDSESIQVFLNPILNYIASHKMLTIVKSKYVCMQLVYICALYSHSEMASDSSIFQNFPRGHALDPPSISMLHMLIVFHTME